LPIETPVEGVDRPTAPVSVVTVTSSPTVPREAIISRAVMLSILALTHTLLLVTD
jgi:hypothetical protein